ncbi:MAG: PQQ-like beta-propeller repeat protein, partial [Planctomycetes bacterium]|nr:PQQ-like beta-propeller repeat protein [Planctomycetota bacterium]
MSRADRRRRRRVALCAALGLAASTGPAAPAQDGFRGWEQLPDPRWRFDPDTHQFNSFQVAGAAPVRDLIDEWETLRREGATVAAARKLQELIDDHGASALQLADDRYVGAAEWARWLVRTASTEIRTAYARLAAQVGAPALARASADQDRHALRLVARRFANSAVGQEALLELALLLRERGARQLAAIHARRVLDFALAPLPGEEARSAALATRATALAALCDGGDGLPEVPGAVAVGGLPPQPLADLVAGAPPPPPPAADEWPTLGGDATRTRIAAPPERPLDLDRSFELEVENDRWSGLRSPLRDMVHAPIQPIRLGDRLYVNNTLSVRCFDLLTRALVWEHEGQQVFAKGFGEDGFLSVSDFTPRSEHDDPTWSKALVAGLSAAHGVVIANLQVPLIHRSKSYQGFRINDPCPIRGLVALDAETGAQLWEQRPLVHDRLTDRFDRPEVPRRGDPGALLSRLDVPAPPAIVDDVAFALGHRFEGAVNTYLAALDVRTGEPWYVVPLASGQQELSMFNMPFQEFTLGCSALADGTLYCATNVGLVTATDAAFGDLRWVKEYPTLPIVEPRNYFRNNPRSVVWHNRGALAGDDLALFTPHDSRALFSLDPATGKERWSRPFTTGESFGPTSQLIGVAGARAFVAVAGKVLALALQGGRIEWAWPDNAPDGASTRRRDVRLAATAALARDALWLPLDQELVVLSLEGREIAAA